MNQKIILYVESCLGVVEPTNLEYDDDILSTEYELFSCGV